MEDLLIPCPNCAVQIKDKARFCPACGAKVHQPDATMEFTGPPSELEKWELVEGSGYAFFRDPVSGKTWMPTPPPLDDGEDEDGQNEPPALPPQDRPLDLMQDDGFSLDAPNNSSVRNGGSSVKENSSTSGNGNSNGMSDWDADLDEFNATSSRRRGGWGNQSDCPPPNCRTSGSQTGSVSSLARSSSMHENHNDRSRPSQVFLENGKENRTSVDGSEDNNNGNNDRTASVGDREDKCGETTTFASAATTDTPISHPSNGIGQSLSTSLNYSPDALHNLWLTSTNIHVLGVSLNLFFTELFAARPTLWVSPIKNKLLFLLMSRTVMVEAFLYGERSPDAIEGNGTPTPKRMQDWLRWIIPLFSPPLDDTRDNSAEAESAVPLLPLGLQQDLSSSSSSAASLLISSVPPSHKENEPAQQQPLQSTSGTARTLEKQAILMIVTLLHHIYREGNAERWAAQLALFLSRMQGLGWNEVNSNRVRDIFKAILTKIENSDALALKRNFEHPCWDNLLVLVNVLEEFCFLTPLYGFQVQPEPGTVGVHLDVFGCSDREILSLCNELLNTKLAVGTESIAPGVIRDSKDAKDYKKRKDQLMGAGQFIACAAKWAETFGSTVDQAIRNSNEMSSISAKHHQRRHLTQFEFKELPVAGVTPAYEKIVGELMEYLSKRKGFKKKQATYMLYQAVEICRLRHFSKTSKGSESVNSGTNLRTKSHQGSLSHVGGDKSPNSEFTWSELAPEAVSEQTKAGIYNLRRVISFLTKAIKTQEEFVIASNKVMYKEVKKAYFCPGFDVPPAVPEDGIPSVVDASALILNLTNALTLRVQGFVEEVTTEVLAPLTELQTAYIEASTNFQQQWIATEKIIEVERLRLQKEYEAVEKEVAELNLVSFEYEEAKRISLAAEKKALQKRTAMAQRTALRVQKYEKASSHFESNFLPATLGHFQTQIATIQKMERRRLRSSKLYLSRYLAAFSRFSSAYTPKFELSTVAVFGLDEIRDMNRFTTNTRRQPAMPPLPKLATSSSVILESVPMDALPIVFTCEHCGNSTDGLSDTCMNCGQAGKGSEDKDQQLTVHFEAYMEEQGYPDAARTKMRSLPSSHKLALLAAAQSSKKDAETKTQKQDLPAYWSKILSAPSKISLSQLKSLKLVIMSKGTKKWLQEFAAAAGLEHLLSFLESRSIDSSTTLLKHEALGCLVAIMKNKIGLQIVSRIAAPSLSSILSSPDYSQSDKVVILELLSLIAVSEEGKKPIAVAFERNLEVLVGFCVWPEKCPKCEDDIPVPYALSCTGTFCDREFSLEIPLASFTLITQIIQSLKDKDTATGYHVILEEFGLSKIRKNFREHCQNSKPLMAQCDIFDALAAKMQELPSKTEQQRASSRSIPASPKHQPAPPPSTPISSVRKIDVLGKMKLGLAKARGVASPKLPVARPPSSKEDSSVRRGDHKKKSCDSCGVEVALEDIFCTECGTSLVMSLQPVPPPPPPTVISPLLVPASPPPPPPLPATPEDYPPPPPDLVVD